MVRFVASGIVALSFVSCAVQAPEAVSSVPAEEVLPAPVLELPADVRARVRLALERHEAGDYGFAAEVLTDAAEELPGVHSLAARSLLEDGRLADAHAHAIRGLEEAACQPFAHFMVGLSAFRLGQFDESERAYLRVLELVPHAGEAWNNLGSIHYRREEFVAAREATERALELANDDESRAIALLNLAELDTLDGELELAEARMTESLSLTPEGSWAYFSLAALYDVTGREAAATTMASYAVELDPFGEVQRATSFVWPELALHHDALVAEARGDVARARSLWRELQALEDERPLRWSLLEGRARAHLDELGRVPTGPADLLSLARLR